MAQIIVSLRIMPEGVEVNLDSIIESVKEKVSSFGGEVGKAEKVPVAFGIQALSVLFVMDESKGSTDRLESEISTLPGVESVEVTDVRRALG